MGFSLFPENTQELSKEWELRFFVLLSLFLQLILVTQGFRRKFSYKCWIRVVVWTAYPLADLIATLTLGVLLDRLATIKETKGTIDPKSQIAAYWVPFLLLHLGGPDTITAYALKDIELWLRQLARLCVHVGLACYAYFVTFSGSKLSILAAGMILVGFIKYVERTLCLYWATEGQLRDSMLSRPEDALKKEEVPAPEDLSVKSGQAIDKEKDSTLVEAYKLFKIFEPLFVGLILSSDDLEASKRTFMNSAMDSATAFGIVEIELGFMYDLLFTKAPLLTRTWGIIRWVINLSVPCAALVFFSLQDRKDYPKVDIYITFLLIGAAILLEIYSVLLAISSDWVEHLRLQRPGGSTISFAVAFLRICQTPRWSNSVAQFSLLKLSVGKRNRIFTKYLRLTKLDEKVEKNFCIDYKEFKSNIKEWIFCHMRDTVRYLEQDTGVKPMSLKLEALRRSENDHLDSHMKDTEFERSILIWHIATELCYYKDHDNMQRESSEHIKDYKMSRLVSRYMLYLLVYHPFMLQPGIHAPRYTDTLVDARRFFEDKLAVLSKKETSINSSIVKTWAHNLFKEKNMRYCHTRFESCDKVHKSAESRDLCEVRHLLLQVETQLPATKILSAKSKSVLLDACHLASQLNEIEPEDFGRKWYVISKVWAKFLIYAACKSKGYEHCKSLNEGGELISHVWLLMAHLGVAELVQTSEGQ